MAFLISIHAICDWVPACKILTIADFNGDTLHRPYGQQGRPRRPPLVAGLANHG